MSELTLTEPAADMFAAVIDMFNAATAPDAASSLPSLTLGDSGGGGGFGFSFGGSATAAADGGAAPSGGGEGGGAAPAAPSAD